MHNTAKTNIYWKTQDLKIISLNLQVLVYVKRYWLS